jgi:hypothetical protein
LEMMSKMLTYDMISYDMTRCVMIWYVISCHVMLYLLWCRMPIGAKNRDVLEVMV